MPSRDGDERNRLGVESDLLDVVGDLSLDFSKSLLAKKMVFYIHKICFPKDGIFDFVIWAADSVKIENNRFLGSEFYDLDENQQRSQFLVVIRHP